MTMTTSRGPYAAFILAAYAAAAVIVACLIAWVLLDRRHLLRQIAQIEAQGVTRRSERAREERP